MKYIFPFLLIFLLLLPACVRKKESCNCTVRPEVEKYNDSLLSAREYLLREYFERLGENSLRQNGTLSIRFLRHNSMTPYTLLYTIQERENEYQLETKAYRMNDHGGYEIVRKKSKNLSPATVQQIVKLINDSCFWTMVSQRETAVIDGVAHILEVYDPEENSCTDKQYRLVCRFSLEPGFKSICSAIMSQETDMDQYK